jgi:hypothetical protein
MSRSQLLDRAPEEYLFDRAPIKVFIDDDPVIGGSTTPAPEGED